MVLQDRDARGIWDVAVAAHDVMAVHHVLFDLPVLTHGQAARLVQYLDGYHDLADVVQDAAHAEVEESSQGPRPIAFPRLIESAATLTECT